MDLSLSEDRTMLRDSLTRALAKESTPARIRAAEKTGHDPALWRVFSELGLPLLRVSEENGGIGLGLFDAVLVAETVGQHIAVIPAVDVMVAARLLSDLGTEAALALLGQVAEGEVIGLALADAAATPEQLVATGASAKAIVFRSGDEIRSLAGPLGEAEANLGSFAARTVALAGGEVIASGPAAVKAFEAAIEEWKLLNAATIAAAAKQAILNAAEYAKERHAFGRPIGSYQGLAHPLAEAFAEVEGAGLLIWRTVEAIGAGREDAAAMVSLATWWAANCCQPAVIKAMRVFGGYGMTLEYDAQIFFRRVTALSLLMGDPAFELERAADRLWNGAEVALPEVGDVGITFEPPPETEAAAEGARRAFAKHITPELERWSFESGDGYDPELYRLLRDEGVLFPDWPKEHGGGGFDAFSSTAIAKVYVDNNWSRVIVSVTDMLGKMLIHFGSDEARREILPKLANAEAQASLGYTEPSCGSDIFAVKTTAVKDGDDWIINGQKMFTSQGHLAQYSLMLTRTSEDKHGGVTLFALPLDLPGYACDPIETIGGETTNTTFYDNMRVPDRYRLGEVNGGVKVLSAALTMEQGSADHYVGSIKEMLTPAVAWARATPRGGQPAILDPAVKRVLASVAARQQVIDALSQRTCWAAATGNARKHYGPSGKLFGSEAWISCSADLMQLTAPFNLLQGYTTLGRIEKLYRRSVPSTIYAGSSEVQRSTVAEAGLGLPRTRN